MDKSKPFGLILSKKVGKFDSKRKSVFDSSSDEEIAEKGKFPKVSLPSSRSKIRVKVESTEDQSIYEYDKIYDEMKASKETEIAEKKKQDSRYIESLLKAATKRKKEHERRVEKKIHVEREKEGSKFKDKEEFVTSAYKKKMQEMEEEEKRESRENQLNEMMDVTKQKDLSGFYRHFLKQTVGEEKIPVYGDRLAIKQEEDAELPKDKVQGVEEKPLNTENKTERIKFKSKHERHQFVQKEIKKPDATGDKIKQEPIDKTDNLLKSYNEDCDADSNSTDKSSESSGDEDSVPSSDQESVDKKGSRKERVKSNKESMASEEIEQEPKDNTKAKTFKDIFTKRTVGIIFDEAQARYFARRAAIKTI